MNPLSDQLLNMHVLYGTPVWLKINQPCRLESIQRRALKLIYGRDNHEMNMLPSLSDRREDLAKRFFNSLINPTNCLHYLLPPKRDINVISKLRHVKLFACPTTRTERFKNSTIIYALNNFQWHFYLRFYSLTFMLFLSSRKAAIHNKLVYY